MKCITLFLLFYFNVIFACEHSVSLALKNIGMAQAIQRFDTYILPPRGTTLSQELAMNNIILSFNRESKHMLLRGKDERSIYLIHDLIQRHIDT